MLNCKSFYQVVCFIQLSEAGVLCVSRKMDKIEYRAVKKFFVKEGLTPDKIHSKFIIGQKPVVQRQRRQVRFHQQERSWYRCLGC
jgi:hypothetical protein